MASRNNILTNRQYELYIYVKEYIEEYGQSPTLNELCTKFERSKSNICELLYRIEGKGYIRIKKNKKRGIRLVMIEKYDITKKLYKDNFKKEKNVKYGFSKSHKQSRRSKWSK